MMQRTILGVATLLVLGSLGGNAMSVQVGVADDGDAPAVFLPTGACVNGTGCENTDAAGVVDEMGDMMFGNLVTQGSNIILGKGGGSSGVAAATSTGFVPTLSAQSPADLVNELIAGEPAGHGRILFGVEAADADIMDTGLQGATSWMGADGNVLAMDSSFRGTNIYESGGQLIIADGSALIIQDGGDIIHDGQDPFDIDVGGNDAIHVDGLTGSIGIGTDLPGDSLMTVDGNIAPAENALFSLGNATHRWHELWMSSEFHYLDSLDFIEDDSGTTAAVLTSAGDFTIPGELVASRVVGGPSAGDGLNEVSHQYNIVPCPDSEILKRTTTGAVTSWTCAADEDTQYSGANFAISDQDCGIGATRGIDNTGALSCTAIGWGEITDRPAGLDDGDDDTTYSGTDFATSDQACGVGDVVTGVDASGAVTCTSVDWGVLTGVPGGFADGIDHDTTYTAGAGLTSLGTTFEVDTASIQSRVASTCPAESSIQAISASGTVTCETDDDTTYSGSDFAVSDQSCSVDHVANGVASNGLLQCVASPSPWLIGGNAGTNPSTQFIGTTDAQPLTFRTDSNEVLVIGTGVAPSIRAGHATNDVGAAAGAVVAGGGNTGSPNTATQNFATVSGGSGNEATDFGATIGGGANNIASQSHTTIGGGIDNEATSDLATVGGGMNNIVNDYAGTIAGGKDNWIMGPEGAVLGGRGNWASASSAIAGGDNNRIWIGATHSFIGGGEWNEMNANYGVIGGGGGTSSKNKVHDNYGTISGGKSNTAGDGTGTLTDAQYATVGGGVQNTASGLASTIAGGFNNAASGDDSAVGGGFSNVAAGATSGIGAGDSNHVAGDDSFIGGGTSNTVPGAGSFVGGGNQNDVSSYHSFIGGGDKNTVSAHRVAIGGGFDNEVTGQASHIGSGYANTVAGRWSTISGGSQNGAAGDFATVPGGWASHADGNYSSASGRLASATHDNSFVWGGAAGASTSSFGAETFTARSPGGVRFYSANGTTGVELATGSGSWSSLSDETAKTSWETVDGQEVLDRLSDLRVQEWSYLTEGEVRHMGPTAQEFHAAFGLGPKDTTITSVDADGVNMAATQALYDIVKEQQAQIEALTTAIEGPTTDDGAAEKAPRAASTSAAMSPALLGAMGAIALLLGVVLGLVIRRS